MAKGQAPKAGLRERKKQRTRQTIARAALELFAEHGFHETTIPAIAEAADVSPRTVSSYFPAKEDLVFPDATDVFGRLREHLGDRPAEQTTADALRAWISAQVADWAERDDEYRAVRRIIDSDPGLQAYEQRQRVDAERMIACAIADDLGASPDELEPRMAAAATFAVFTVIGDHKDAETCVPPRSREEEGRDILALLDRALRFVDAGIRALRDGQDVPFLAGAGPAPAAAAGPESAPGEVASAAPAPVDAPAAPRRGGARPAGIAPKPAAGTG